jgi:MFS family permease
VLAALTLTNRIRIWELFVLAALLGVVNAFDIPARQSFLVEMVGRGDLMNAIALNSSMFNGARIIGPAVAGILVAKIGEGWCFFANGISYVAVIWGLLLMKVKPFRPVPASMSPWETIREGFQYVGGTVPIRAIVMLIAVVSFAGMPYTVLMPIFADRILHAGPQGLGMLMGATGVGALGGALLLASRTELRGFTVWIPTAAGVFAISLAGFAASSRMWLSCAMLFVAGFAVMLQVGASNTLIQSMVPDRLRGRAMSVYSMMYIGIGPFGAMVAGFAAGGFGARFTILAGAVVCLLAGTVFAFQLPAIRPIARQLIRDRQATDEVAAPVILDPAPAPR